MQNSNFPDLHHYAKLNKNRSIIEVPAYIRPFTPHKKLVEWKLDMWCDNY